MAQSMRPIDAGTPDDITNTSGSPTPGYTEVDGTAPDTGTYWSGNDNATGVLEVLMTDLSGSVPQAGTCTVIIYEAQADGNSAPSSGGSAPTFDLQVYEGATQRASVTGVTPTESAFTIYNTLTFNASTVTDWSDVRVRFTSNGTGGTPSGRRGAAVSYIEITTPDTSTDTEISGTLDSFTLTENKASIDLDIKAAVDAFTLTENQATVANDVGVSGAVDAFTLTENKASVDLNIQASVDAFTLTEYQATVQGGAQPTLVRFRRHTGFV